MNFNDLKILLSGRDEELGLTHCDIPQGFPQPDITIYESKDEVINPD